MVRKLFIRALFAYFVIACSIVAAPVVGQPCPYKLVDVDGRTLSASQGVVTILVLTSRPDAEKVKLVADRVPGRCLGNPSSRMVTVIRFQPTRNRATRYILSSLIRRRVDNEALQLRQRYLAKKLTRDPRRDVYVVADFDAQVASELGLDPHIFPFRVLVVSGSGILLRDWSGVPDAKELDAAMP
ncbi:MAG: hypothetical protein ACJ8M1_01220 [Chthoniobacterales bacterium]